MRGPRFPLTALLCCALVACAFATGCNDPCGDCCPGGQCAPAGQPFCGCPDNPFATSPQCPGGQCPTWNPAGAIGEAESAPIEVDINAQSEPKGGDCATCPQARSPFPTSPAVQLVAHRRPAPQPQATAPRAAQAGPTVVYGLPQGPPALGPNETLGQVGPWRIVSPQPAQTMPRQPAAQGPANHQPEVCPDCPQRPGTAAAETPREGIFSCVRCNKATVGKEWHEVWGDDDTPLTILCERCWQSTGPAERRGYLDAYMERSGLSKSQKFYGRAAFDHQ